MEYEIVQGGCGGAGVKGVKKEGGWRWGGAWGEMRGLGRRVQTPRVYLLHTVYKHSLPLHPLPPSPLSPFSCLPPIQARYVYARIQTLVGLFTNIHKYAHTCNPTQALLHKRTFGIRARSSMAHKGSYVKCNLLFQV